ncbi:NINE protein [Agromyces sp. NPDC055520]
MSLEAGWYDDESDAALLRYWDGAGWTPHTASRPADVAPNPLPAATPPSAPPAFGATAQYDHSADDDPGDDVDEYTMARPAGFSPQPPLGQAAPYAPPASPFAPPATSFAPPAAAEFPAYTLPAPPGYTLQEQTTAPLPPAHGAAPAAGQFSYEPYRSAGRTFIATWLFAMLLGFWGADRFYLGKIGTAIAKLLTLGGLGVWVLVDLLLVLTGAQRDRDGRALEGYDEHKRTAWIVTGALVGLSVLSSIVSGIANLLVR